MSTMGRYNRTMYAARVGMGREFGTQGIWWMGNGETAMVVTARGMLGDASGK